MNPIVICDPLASGCAGFLSATMSIGFTLNGLFGGYDPFKALWMAQLGLTIHIDELFGKEKLTLSP